MKMKKFEEFLNESIEKNKPIVKKGDTVPIKLMLFEGQPDSTVVSYDDSYYNKATDETTFSFLMGGDMMMIAKWDGEKWISN